MQTFTDPNLFPREDVKYSPDNRFFAVVTQRGVLQTNELESTIWVFDSRAVERFLRAFPDVEAPKPRLVARMGAVANDSAIVQLRWLSRTELAFLGRNKTVNRSLFTTDITTGALKKLTPSGQDVTTFDMVNGTTVYTVAYHIDALPMPNERVITGHSLSSLLVPKLLDEGDPLLGAKPAGLWVIRNQRISPVLELATRKPVQVITTLLSLSPSGHSVVVAQPAERVPKVWEEYEPFPCPACGFWRLKASTPETTQIDLAVREDNPKQYALVDLDTGKIDPIDAPLGQNLLYSGPEKAIWLRDGQSLILVDTYLPLEDTQGTEREQRRRRPCVALLDKASRCLTCIAIVEQGSREDLARTGAASFLRDALWDEARRDLTLSYETVSNANDTAQHEHAPEVYRQEQGRWISEERPTRSSTAPLKVEVQQDLNRPPALFVREGSGTEARKLWDPNPQLSDLFLGEVSVFRWRDKAGYEWTAGLVKPPNYLPGHRYPLVIQTHGFNQHEFMTVGTYTTAFAARPMAARGMVVLQVDERFDLMGTPEEAPLHAAAYLSAVDRLASDGLVDPGRVGLIGFSRTGYYTLEALTKAPKRFTAATIADSDFLGYMQRLLGVDLESKDVKKKEGIAIYGSQPFGNGLKTWIEKAPAFNLDKILAPLRLEAHDLDSLVGIWEAYAGLRLQGKPVDLIQLPNAIHQVSKPLERFASEQGDADWFDFWLNGHEDPDPTKAEQYARWRFLREQTEQILQSSK